MPQKPAVRARKKRRDARRLERWRAKKLQQSAQEAQPQGTAPAEPRS